MRHVDPRQTFGGADNAAGGAAAPADGPRLRIVHFIRAPVGGLFRHVRDLAAAQAGAGHQVGIVADAATGGAAAEAAFAALEPSLALGIHRFAMARDIALSDVALVGRLTGRVRALRPDVLHGHGAKGGVYARSVGTLLRATGRPVARVYTPHGGSLHFDAASAKGRIYFTAERALARLTDAFVFVCQYERDTFTAKVGRPRAPATVALNGLRPDEFEPVALAADARDFLFIGELRALKGPDVFVAALAAIARANGRVTERGDRGRRAGPGPDRNHGQRHAPHRRDHLPRGHAGQGCLRAGAGGGGAVAGGVPALRGSRGRWRGTAIGGDTGGRPGGDFR